MIPTLQAKYIDIIFYNFVSTDNHYPAMKIFVLVLALIYAFTASASQLDSLLNRIQPELSEKITIRITPGQKDFFLLEQDGDKPSVTANNAVSAAMGVHWYLKYHVGTMLTWSNMTAQLPDTLPAVTRPERREADVDKRYYLNYCTFSYSMPFWDEYRWQREIDWMALHGINMPLMLTGSAAVWRNTMKTTGYPEDKIDKFISGPAYQAWWLMNNLQGWGGPQTDNMYRRDEALARFITAKMRDTGIEPVLPGYSGMVPADSRTFLGLNTADPGKWLGYVRPAFLQPADSAFSRIAAAYYAEQQKITGTSKYYAMDPFHEGGSTSEVNLPLAGKALLSSLHKVRPDAEWVIQAWQDNPRAALIDSLPDKSVCVLDLFGESLPQCGDSTSPWYRPAGFGSHPRIWCMLLNYGGNVGLHGKLRHLPQAYARQRRDTLLQGVGMTMEGIENNEIMYELLSELPWRDTVDIDKWLLDYTRARYGRSTPDIDKAWQILGNSIYNAPADNRQQGTTESLFCARPCDNPHSASTWALSEPYYNSADVLKAAVLFASGADSIGNNSSYLYDLVDITRQAVTECGRTEAGRFAKAASENDSTAYRHSARRFLALIQLQDTLLGTHRAFRLGNWTEQARKCGATPEEKELYELNARTLITIWGGREASDNGGLHDYSHREWQGLLKDFYYPRWFRWFKTRLDNWGSDMPQIDWWSMENEWVHSQKTYAADPQGDLISTARYVLQQLSNLYGE